MRAQDGDDGGITPVGEADGGDMIDGAEMSAGSAGSAGSARIGGD